MCLPVPCPVSKLRAARATLNVDKLVNGLKRTSVVGDGVIVEPSDICAVDDKWLLISDYKLGIFAYDQVSNLCLEESCTLKLLLVV